MKITHIIMNLDAGGAQTFVASLAIEQKRLGHDVSIIVIDELVNSNFQVLLMNSLKAHDVQLYCMNRRLGKNVTIFKTVNGIIRTLAAINPDVINSHISTAHLIVKLCLKYSKIRAMQNRQVITVHNAPEAWHGLTTYFNKHTPTIYCSYSALEMNPKRDCMGVAIQNGIPPLHFNDSAIELLDRLSQDRSRKFVLSVGRLSRQKNYDMVCDIAKHFEDKGVDFLVCGIKQETAEQDLRNFSKHPNIHYIGVKTQDEVYSLMGNCDCFLNASIFEGLPITVLEAFFAGIPCVLSEIPPHNEIGTNMPQCYISDLASKEAFINNVEQALSCTDSKQDILNDRQPHLEKYSIKTTANNYIDFYTKVLKSIS